MSKYPPKGGFKRLDPAKCYFDKYEDNSSRGQFFKFDLEYPKELHELHNDYPLAPSKIYIKREISEYQLKIDILIQLMIIKFLLEMLKNQLLTSSTKKSMCFIPKTCNYI